MIVYSMMPLAAGGLVLAVLSLVPLLSVLGALVFGVSAAIGISSLYRGIRDLFGVDSVTSFVAVSVLVLTLVVTLYAFAGVSILSNPALSNFGG